LGAAFRHKTACPHLRAIPVGYAVSPELFPKSPAAHTGIYDSVAKRNVTPLQMDPETSIKWKEITPLTDFYINKDDAYAAEELLGFFSREHRLTQLRLGTDYTYEDLQSSPAVLVGANNNPWMDRVMSDLPSASAKVEKSCGSKIEQSRGRSGKPAWRVAAAVRTSLSSPES